MTIPDFSTEVFTAVAALQVSQTCAVTPAVAIHCVRRAAETKFGTVPRAEDLLEVIELAKILAWNGEKPEVEHA